MIIRENSEVQIRLPLPALVVWWLPRLPIKLGDPRSILGMTSTQGLKRS
jgi:hypothetical protein